MSVLIGRRELFAFAERYASIRLRDYTDLSDGVVLCRLFSLVFPQHRVRTASPQTHTPSQQSASNWANLRAAMCAVGVPVELLDAEALAKNAAAHGFSALVLFYFLFHLTKRTDFFAEFAADVTEELAAFLQSIASIAALVRGGALPLDAVPSPLRQNLPPAPRREPETETEGTKTTDKEVKVTEETTPTGEEEEEVCGKERRRQRQHEAQLRALHRTEKSHRRRIKRLGDALRRAAQRTEAREEMWRSLCAALHAAERVSFRIAEAETAAAVEALLAERAVWYARADAHSAALMKAEEENEEKPKAGSPTATVRRLEMERERQREDERESERESESEDAEDTEHAVCAAMAALVQSVSQDRDELQRQLHAIRAESDKKSHTNRRSTNNGSSPSSCGKLPYNVHEHTPYTHHTDHDGGYACENDYTNDNVYSHSKRGTYAYAYTNSNDNDMAQNHKSVLPHNSAQRQNHVYTDHNDIGDDFCSDHTNSSYRNERNDVEARWAAQGAYEADEILGGRGRTRPSFTLSAAPESPRSVTTTTSSRKVESTPLGRNVSALLAAVREGGRSGSVSKSFIE